MAWGTSLGGMITTGLAERHGHRFAGALAMCGLQQGAVANWNNTLDPVFAIRTLLAPGSTVPLVRMPGPGDGVRRHRRADRGAGRGPADAGSAGPASRSPRRCTTSRPGPTPRSRSPRPDDYDTAQLNQFRTLHLTIYVGLSWRQEAETRAGGNMSWNTGVDYARMLARSSIRAEVEALYARAGLSLAADLAALAAAPRITADPAAVAYMVRNISFTGRLSRRMLTIHTTGDPLVPVQVQHAYADAVDDAGRSRLLRQAYVHRAGHCTFTTGEMLAALRTVERRVATGRWPAPTRRAEPARRPSWTRRRRRRTRATGRRRTPARSTSGRVTRWT